MNARRERNDLPCQDTSSAAGCTKRMVEESTLWTPMFPTYISLFYEALNDELTLVRRGMQSELPGSTGQLLVVGRCCPGSIQFYRKSRA